jgi:hypothetical protein
MSFAQDRSCHIVADERLFMQLRIQSSGRLHLRRGARLSTKKGNVTGVEWSQSSLAPKPCLAIFSRNTLDNTTKLSVAF